MEVTFELRLSLHNILGRMSAAEIIEGPMNSNSKLPDSLAELSLRRTKFKFRAIPGTCVADKAWSETAISSSRNGYGAVSAIHSQNITKREIWVRIGNGREFKFALPDNTDFAVRDGHQLSLVFVLSKPLGEDRNHCMAILNHDTGRWVFLNRQMLINRLAGVGSWISQSSANLLALLTLGMALIPITWYSNARYQTYVKPLEDHIGKIIKLL